MRYTETKLTYLHMQPQWSAFYAPGREILSYLQNVVDKYKVSQYIRLRHELTSAKWDDASGKWALTIRNNATQESFVDTADLVLSATGGLSRWSWPDIKGLHDFKGMVLHSANWESDLGIGKKEDDEQKWKDKKIGVIGVGSSAIQIVPTLQPRCEKVINFVRGRTCESTFSLWLFVNLTSSFKGSQHLWLHRSF